MPGYGRDVASSISFNLLNDRRSWRRRCASETGAGFWR
jgi:hypothetical protein